MMHADRGRPVPQLRRGNAVELVSSSPAGQVEVSAPSPLVPAVTAAAEPPRAKKLQDRWWFLVVFMAALAIFCSIDGGRIFYDTKLGVDISAGEFLQRLWSLWNPHEWLGSLQDQYIGYAIPMAPFYLVGQLLHVPIWLIERVWIALLVAFGFTGIIKLARALGIGSDKSRLLAGAVFALWPTFTILIGSTSASVLPGLAVPWAILPLVAAAQGRSTTLRAAAQSGVAIAAMSGVNAVCTLVVLLMPALYILTHTKSRQRVLLSLQWGAAVIAATSWWTVPLLLQGRYAFNFLPYIEQSATTTATLSAAAVLRGTGTWTAYFNLGGAAWLPAGWAVVTSPLAILASAIASAVGLSGLARRDMPERRWLSLCAGIVAMAALAGYYGPLGGPWHTAVDHLLDGTLAPFRSLYKVEPVLAVALALGCAHALDRYWRMNLLIGRKQLAASAATAPLVALSLVGLAWPQLTGQLFHTGSFQRIPAYWYQTASYLAAHSAQETALVVPANPHSQYTWGTTIDNPLEPLASSPWVERGLVPYGGAGSQILLQTAEQAIESGHQVPGLAGYLDRAGIRYVVVRNDNAPNVAGYTPPQVVNETLAQSGFRQVAAFGPQVRAAPSYPDLAGVVPGFAPTYPAIQIFAAADSQLQPASPVAALPVSKTVLVNGGPDSLLQLEAQGILGDQPAVIAGQQLTGTPALWAVTDGQRRADTDFGSVGAYQSFTYTATQDNPVDDPLGGAGAPPRQLLPVSAAGHQTVAVLTGAASVTASSAGSWLGESPQYSPVNAFDGDPATAWTESDPRTPVGQWIQIRFTRLADLPASAAIRLLDQRSRPVITELRVTTAAGSVVTDTVRTGAVQPLRLPPGRSTWLRVTILRASNVVPFAAGAGISDVLIPGLRVTSYLQPAEDFKAGASSAAAAYSFSQQAPSPYNQDSNDGVATNQAMNRTFVMSKAGTLTATLAAVPVPGPTLNALLTALTGTSESSYQVTASSSWASLPLFGPDSMYAVSPRLPWIAAAGDKHPELDFTWRRRRTIREIVLQSAFGVARAPTAVLVRGEFGVRQARVGLGGIVKISPPLRTNKLEIQFTSLSSAVAGNTGSGQPAQLPVGLARVIIPGLFRLQPAVPQPAAGFRLRCGAGPTVSVDGHNYQTSVTGTQGDLIQLRPVQLQVCSPGESVTLAAGRHWLVAGHSADFTVTSLSLTSQPAPETAGTGNRTLSISHWGADNRSLRIGPGAAAYVEIHEDSDPGWTASLAGHPLKAVTLDGWQQGFVVPAGTGGTITLTFQPAVIYHAGLIISAILLLMLIAMAIGVGRVRSQRFRRVQANEAGRDWFEPAQTPPAQPSHDETVLDADAGRHRQAPPAPTADVTGQLPVGGYVTSAWLAKAGLMLLPLSIVIAVAGGPIAIAVPVLAVVGYWRPRWLPGIAAGAMLATGVLVATSKAPTAMGSGPFSGLAQVLALVALAAALLPALTRPSQ